MVKRIVKALFGEVWGEGRMGHLALGGWQVTRSARCQQRDKGGEHILLTFRSGTMQGVPQVRYGQERGAQPCREGYELFCQPSFSTAL